MHTKTYLVVSTLVLAVLLTGSVNGIFVQGNRSVLAAAPTPKVVTRTVTVTGSSQEYLAPDIAYATIVVVSEGDDPEMALKAKESRAQSVNIALVTLGVDEKDIQARNFEIYTQPEYDLAGNPTDKMKYIVNNSIFVTFRDISIMGGALNAAFHAGAKTISNIKFDVGETAREAAFSRAREAAVNDAGGKADELAGVLGVNVGEVQTITETSSIELQQTKNQNSTTQTTDTAIESGQAGQILLTMEVKIVYEIVSVPAVIATPTPKK